MLGNIHHQKRKRPGPLPKARKVGTIVHYYHPGLENRLMVESEGLYYEKAELFTYAAIAQTHPVYIHDTA